MLERITRALHLGSEYVPNDSKVRVITQIKIDKGSESRKDLGYESYRGKYQLLHNYLKNCEPSFITLTIQDVEQIIGFKLPESATKYSAWWANDLTHSHAKAWLLAGWEVNGLSLGTSVNFTKIPD